jgi:hypothetical protein
MRDVVCEKQKSEDAQWMRNRKHVTIEIYYLYQFTSCKIRIPPILSKDVL